LIQSRTGIGSHKGVADQVCILQEADCFRRYCISLTLFIPQFLNKSPTPQAQSTCYKGLILAYERQILSFNPTYGEQA
jgi:hypothetical protein